MKYFDNVKDNILNYSLDNIKPLKDCIETIKLLETENADNNEYKKLAENFVKYENRLEKDSEESDDWYFYKYLKSLGYDEKYIFPLKDGGKVEAKVYLFKPFDSDLKNSVNPLWHLLISYYGYIDAAFNHNDNEYAKKITEKNGWKISKPITKEFKNNKVLFEWMKEAKK